MGISASIDIKAPANIVWKWVTDTDCLVQWLPGLISDEVIEEKEGHVGTRFKQVWNHGGKDMEMTGVVKESVENERIVVDLDCNFFAMTIEDDLVHADGVTRLTQTSHVRYKGCMILMGWLFSLLMKGKMKRQTVEQLEKLKSFCEAEASGTPVPATEPVNDEADR